MTTEEKLKSLILSKYKSIRGFVQVANLPYATVDSILRRGVNHASVGNVIKICNTLEISADSLADGKIVSIHEIKEKPNNLHELQDIIEYTKTTVGSYSFLTIDGKPMTKEEIESFLDGITIVVEMIRKKRKG